MLTLPPRLDPSLHSLFTRFSFSRLSESLEQAIKGGLIFSHTQGAYRSSTVFWVKLTIFRMSWRGGGNIFCGSVVSKIPITWRYSFVLPTADKGFPGLPVYSFGRCYSPSTSFRAFSLGRATENSVTRSVFSKP